MKAIPKHFRLVSEKPDHYEIHDTRDKKHFRIPKRDLDLAMHAKLSKIQKFAEGGEASGKYEGTDIGGGAGVPDSPPPVTVNVNAGTPAPSVGDQVSQAMSGRFAPAPMASSPAAPSEPVPVAPRAPAVQAPAPTSFVQQGQGAQALSEKGVREQGAAEAQAADANAQVLQQNNARMQKVMEGYTQSRASLDKEHEDLTQAVMNQKIDPDRYWHNKSLPGKISTAIGVILGGIGAGLQHSTTNQALQVVQDAIKQDIDAQKAELGKKQTLLSVNLERYKNLDAATAATMAQMNSLVAGQLQLNAAKSGNLRAKGNTDYAIGVLRNKYLLEAPNLAMQDYKVKELHELQGTSAPEGASRQILGTSPAAAPASSGPTGLDLQQEQNALNGKPMAVNPSRYGAGVNQNKLTALKVTGLMDKETGHKATEEYGKYVKLQHELQEADSVFNIAAHNATKAGRLARKISPQQIEGGGAGGDFVSGMVRPIAYGIKNLITLGEEQTKQYDAVVEPFVDKLAKDVTGRSTPISIEKLGKLMPEHGDDLKTLAIKRAKLHDTLKSSYSFPTLLEHNLVHPNDPLVNLDSERK